MAEIEVSVAKSLEDEINHTYSDAEVKKLLKKKGKDLIGNPLNVLKKYGKRKDVDIDLLLECKKYIDVILEKNKQRRKELIQSKIDALQNELNMLGL